MKRRSHLAAWLLLWLAGLVAWPLWSGPERMLQRAIAERAAVERTFGPRLGGILIGVAGSGGAAFASDEPARTPARVRAGIGREASGLSAMVADRSNRYLAALGLQVQGALLRAMSLAAWMVLLMPLWFAGIVDGLARRAVTLDSLGYQSPAAFALASHALIICAMAPLLVLVLPFALPHAVIPGWALLTLLPLGVAIRHMQPVFAR